VSTAKTENFKIAYEDAINILQPYWRYLENKELYQIPLDTVMEKLLDSREVMWLLNIKSPTTLIKYEREGLIKVDRRFGNQKRYSSSQIKRLLGE